MKKLKIRRPKLKPRQPRIYSKIERRGINSAKLAAKLINATREKIAQYTGSKLSIESLVFEATIANHKIIVQEAIEQTLNKFKIADPKKRESLKELITKMSNRKIERKRFGTLTKKIELSEYQHGEQIRIHLGSQITARRFVRSYNKLQKELRIFSQEVMRELLKAQ